MWIKFNFNFKNKEEIMKKFIKRNILTLFFLLIFLIGCDNSEPEQNDNTISLRLGNQIIQVEIADTQQKRVLGLSYRDTLAQDHGMLFIFPYESRKTFWMRGCNFDIDLAYIESDGTISEIITMKKEPLDTPLNTLKEYPSQSTTVKYVLEMIGGWFEENNISIETKIDLSQF
jgi:uncharacterized protein